MIDMPHLRIVLELSGIALQYKYACIMSAVAFEVETLLPQHASTVCGTEHVSLELRLADASFDRSLPTWRFNYDHAGLPT